MEVGEIVRHVVQIYDLMAVVCHKICLLNSQMQRKIYRAYWRDPKSVCLTVENVFGFLKKYNEGHELLYDSLTFDEIDEILEKIESWSNTSSDNKMLIYLLGYLDRRMLFEKSMENFFQSAPCKIPNVHRFECLNGNDVVCCGRLLPRFEPVWAKENRRPRTSLDEHPLSVMQNYFWVEDTGKWKVDNVYSSKWDCGVGKPYTVVCSPVTNRPTFDYEKVPGEEFGSFIITNYHDEDQQVILERLKQTLAVANMKQANIVLFPEMIASRDCQMTSQEIVKSLWQYGFPRILCLPSSEFEENGNWKNQTIVLNDSGLEIFQYNKQEAFQLDEKQKQEGEKGIITEQIFKFFEPIIPDYKLTIMHVKGLGRIGVVICADIFNTELSDMLLNKYEVRLLLIMAYTTGYDQFFRDISVAQKTSCDVIWCNACAAYTATGKTGPAVAYFSYGHKSRSENVVRHCCPGDVTPCDGCTVTITIDPLYSEPGTIVYEPL